MHAIQVGAELGCRALRVRYTWTATRSDSGISEALANAVEKLHARNPWYHSLRLGDVDATASRLLHGPRPAERVFIDNLRRSTRSSPVKTYCVQAGAPACLYTFPS